MKIQGREQHTVKVTYKPDKGDPDGQILMQSFSVKESAMDFLERIRKNPDVQDARYIQP